MSDVLEIMKDVFAEIKAQAETVPQDRFCDWYLGEFEKLDALEAKIKEQTTIMLREIICRKQSLQYICGDKFKGRVDAALAEIPRGKDGKPLRKSIKYHTGNAGYHMGQESIRFVDGNGDDSMILASMWAVENFSDAELYKAVGSIEKILMIIEYIKDENLFSAIKSLNCKRDGLAPPPCRDRQPL